MKKEDKYENPFKNDDFENPGKTFEESRKRVKVKIKKIKEAENKEWHENPYIDEKTFKSLIKIKQQAKKANKQIKDFIEKE